MNYYQCNRIQGEFGSTQKIVIDGVTFDDKPFYEHHFNSRTSSPTLKWNWKSKCMPKIKFFIWLLVKDKGHTWNMLTRNQYLELGYNCVLRNRGLEETLAHLIFGCPFSTNCWYDLGNLLEDKMEIHDKKVQAKAIFSMSILHGNFLYKKQRNGKIIYSKPPSVDRWKKYSKRSLFPYTESKMRITKLFEIGQI